MTTYSENSNYFAALIILLPQIPAVIYKSMIHYHIHKLSNGMKVILHQDNSVQTAAINILYNVGARNENPEMTGMAHLFEHLMFSGSLHAEDYDEILQTAGGENNAYTTNDITNYYITLPHQNIETALWLESDRMQYLNINEHSLDVQKKVVIEEFKEHYINKPYGDAWKHLRELAYTSHPYQWMTIGKELDHIEKVTLDDALTFYKKFYNPGNAILCVAGKFDETAILELCETYFGHIPGDEIKIPEIADEPVQVSQRIRTICNDVPLNAVWIAYPMASRTDDRYYMADIISDILGSGKTAVLYQEFVKNRQTFTEISCYHTGSIDNGLLIIEGKISNEADSENARQELMAFIDEYRTLNMDINELNKIRNRIESLIVFEDIQLLNRANNLAYYNWLGDTNGINTELERYLSIELDQINDYLPELLHPEKSNVLIYNKTSA